MDGFRCLAIKSGGLVRLLSRNGRNLNLPFPEIVEELHALPDGVALDGELVVLDARGHPQFEQLSARALMTKPFRIKSARIEQPAALFAFDVLTANGRDQRKQPLYKRKVLLEKVLKGRERVRYLNHIGENGERLFEEVTRLELEGIVGKKIDTPYVAGRCHHWVKVKTSAGKARESLRMAHLHTER